MKTRIITIIAFLLSLTEGHAAEGIQIASATLKPGETKDITLSLSQNTEKYAGIQFDIKLPEGLSLGMTGSEVYYSFPSNQADDLTCDVTSTGENAYRFMLYSNSLKLFKSGDLLTLRLKASEGIALKEYSLQLNDVILSDIDGKGTKPANSTVSVKVTDFFKLIYMVDGEEYKTIEYEYGATITPEAAPTKEGYTFSGWKDLPSTMPAKDVTVAGTFTINKYKLTYIVDGKEYKVYEVKYGASITPEADPKKEGHTFSGWSDIPQTMPAKDVTVTGTFTVNKYKLTYVVDGEIYKTYEVEFGSKITPEAAPTKEGYIFSGWKDLPSTMPAKDVTVTSTFTKGVYKLIYMVDDEVYKTVSYEYGASITPEAEPKKEGYTFSGWNEIPETMPGHDVTVTGTFSVNKYKLTYMVDGEVYKSYEIKYGSTITPEAEPKKEGYTFSGWSNIPETMPAYDVTVTGYFTQSKKSGDANGDGTINAADIVEVVNYIMKNPSAIFDASAADVNGDGVVNAADIVDIVNIIMKK